MQIYLITITSKVNNVQNMQLIKIDVISIVWLLNYTGRVQISILLNYRGFSIDCFSPATLKRSCAAASSLLLCSEMVLFIYLFIFA